MSPLTVRYDDGQSDQVFPSRAITAVETGKAQTSVWHFNAAGLIEQVTIYAEVQHVRAALGLHDD